MTGPLTLREVPILTRQKMRLWSRFKKANIPCCRTRLRYVPEQIAAQRISCLPGQVIEVDARVDVPPRGALTCSLHRLLKVSSAEEPVIMLLAYRVRRIASKLHNEERWPNSRPLLGQIFELQFDPPVEMGGPHRAGKSGPTIENQLLLAGCDQRMDFVTLEQITVAHASYFHEVELHPISFMLAVRLRARQARRSRNLQPAGDVPAFLRSAMRE